jgi:streptogramin lyase
VDKSQGLNEGAVPYAIYAGSGGVWFTDRGKVKAIGALADPLRQPMYEFPTTGGADPVDITYTRQNMLAYSEASGSSFGWMRIVQGDPIWPVQMALQPIPVGLTQNGIASDPYGTVYFAVGGAPLVSGQGIYYSKFMTYEGPNPAGMLAITNGSYNPTSIIVDHINKLWVTEPDLGRVEMIDPFKKTLMTEDFLARPTSITEGPDNLLYVVDAASGAILRLPEFYASTWAWRFQPSCAAAYVTAGIHDDVWFTEPHCNAIGEISLDRNTITEYHNSAYPGGMPDHIAVDTKGNVWFTDKALHKIFVHVTQ